MLPPQLLGNRIGSYSRCRNTVRGRGSRVRGRSRGNTLEPGGRAVNAHWEIIIRITVLEDTCVVVCRHVPVAPHNIIDVVAIPHSIRPNASTDTEFRIREKLGPFVVLSAAAKRVAVNQSTDGVSSTIGTPIVQLAPFISLKHVYFSKVAYARDLDVIGRLDEVDPLEGTIRHKTSTMPSLGAPRNLFTLRVTDATIRRRRSKEAEVLGRIEPQGLAVGTLRSTSAAIVGPKLPALRLSWKLRGQVACVPDLIRITGVALPDVRAIAVGGASSRQINADITIGPTQLIDPLVPVKLLIWIIGGACPNLKKVAIGRIPIRDIQTFVAKDPDVATGERPFLRRISSANLDGYESAVVVRRRGQAFISSQRGLNQKGSCVWRRLGRDSAKGSCEN